MNRTLGFCTLIFALACTGYYGASAQTPPDKKTEKSDPKDGPVSKEGDKKEKDPTQPSDKLKDIMMKKSDADEQGVAATIIAKVVAKNRPPMAILKILDKEYTVTRNSVIELPKVALKITEITLEEVRMELQSLKAGNRTVILK